MATSPLIFPSLSRQPSMDTSKKIEDDTIRDQMESGYVATRPRGTRVRRSWSFNVRNLVAEDIRALDEFFMSPQYAARGGNSFLYPNLLKNWSFEFPALSAVDLVFGWNVASTIPQITVGIGTATVQDGNQAINFATVAGQSVAEASFATGQLNCDAPINCNPGEVYAFTGALNIAPGTLPSAALSANVYLSFYNSIGGLVSNIAGTAVTTAGWQTYGYQFTVPAGAASFAVSLQATVNNTSTHSATALDGSASVSWDCVGCALQTPLTPYGRMVGSQPLGCLVRFPAAPETADIGWGNGVKVYGAKIDLQEV